MSGLIDIVKESDEYRTRLLEGMAAAVSEKGYSDTTIADIVRHARVSKRTFYERFESKEDCLVALYIAASERTLKVIADSVRPELDLSTQINMATEAYFARLAAFPILMRTLFIEIYAAGARGLKVRCEINQRFAELLQRLVAAGSKDRMSRLSPEMAMAIVGGINELVLQAIEGGRVEHLAELTRPAADLVHAVTARSFALCETILQGK